MRLVPSSTTTTALLLLLLASDVRRCGSLKCHDNGDSGFLGTQDSTIFSTAKDCGGVRFCRVTYTPTRDTQRCGYSCTADGWSTDEGGTSNCCVDDMCNGARDGRPKGVLLWLLAFGAVLLPLCRRQ